MATATLPTIDTAATEHAGTVARIRAFGAENDFVVVEFTDGLQATGELDGDTMSAGVRYRFFGRWEHHERYGTRFRFDSFSPTDRQEMMGAVAYLSRSNLGLTKSDAMRLWKQYGADAITTLRERPELVTSEGVLTQAKAEKAAAMLRTMEDSTATQVALFDLFAGRGFPKAAVKACIATWGDLAPSKIRRDPFQMLVKDIPGVGFKRADKLYCDLGHNPLRLKRQTLAAWHWMRTNGSGNTWEIEGGLMKAVLMAAGSFEGAEFVRAVQLGVRARWLAKRIGEDGVAYFAERGNAWSEERLAKHIARIRKHKPLWPMLDNGESGVTDHQRDRLGEFFLSPIGILAGTPGTGKTFTAAAMLRKLLTKIPAGRIAVCAPTGKAAVRITEAMTRYNLPLQATTIHRLLGVGGMSGGKFSFLHNESKPLDEAVIVVDEGSMVDTDLAAALFAAVPSGGNVLVVGDPFQLSPVGHGAPLRDMIAAGVPCGLLEEIKRNSGQIVMACRDIKDGKPFTPSPRVDEANGMNLVHFPADGEDQQQQAVVSLLGALRGQGHDPVWDVQVLVATNDKSKVSRKQLNAVLQEVLNAQDQSVPADLRNPKFRPGDKVICLKNTEIRLVELMDGGGRHVSFYRQTMTNVYLANGDMGRVIAVDSKSAVVLFSMPDRLVKITTRKAKKADGDDGGNGSGEREEDVAFDLAYAITTHKAQGSEFPVAIEIIDENAGQVASREWWYTALSRGSRLSFMVGKLGVALRQAAKSQLGKRKTFLRELLTGPKT